MADSVLFDGTDDYIALSPGEFSANFPDAMSFFAIAKRGSANTYDGISYIGETGVGGKMGMTIKDLDNVLCDTNVIGGQGENQGAGATGSITTTSTTTWYAHGYTKPAGGAATARYHRYDFSLESWQHEAMGPSMNGVAAPLDDCVIGAWLDSGGPGDFFHGNILLVAYWDQDIGGDSNVEALFGGSGTANLLQTWLDSNPLEMIRLDAISGLNTLTGGSMSEISRTGTTVDTGDAPPGWDDTLGGGGTPQDLKPDADTVTTGWTNTPLFSKVNDASDATVIQATLV